MADSESDSTSPRPVSLSMILPFLLGVARSTTESRLNQIVVLDHAARTVVVFEGHVLDSLLHELSEKSGPLPASKDSIDAMPRVGVIELGTDCAVCLEELVIGEEVREMPCKHRYHSDCIEKWLEVHGTCPVCRFAMPVEDREVKKNTGDGDDRDHDHDHDMEEREGRVVVVNLWVNSNSESMEAETDLSNVTREFNLEWDDEMIDASTQDTLSEDSS